MNHNDYGNYLSPSKMLQIHREYLPNTEDLYASPIGSLGDNMNESYMTSNDTVNNTTQFYSVLEDTTTEKILNDISQMNLEVDPNDFTIENESQDIPINSDNVVGQDVVVFQSGNKWFGVEVTQDENGHLQKCQYELVQNAEGNFETVPDSMQLMPLDIVPSALGKAPPTFEHKLDIANDPNSILLQATQLANEPIFIKQEFLPYDNLASAKFDGELNTSIRMPSSGIDVIKSEDYNLDSNLYIDETSTSSEQLQPGQEHNEIQYGTHFIQVQEADCDASIKNMEGVTVKRGILESALKGIYSPTKPVSNPTSSNKVEHIELYINPHDEAQKETEPEEINKTHKVPQGIKRTIALYPASKSSVAGGRRITTIEVPQRRLVPPKTFNTIKPDNPPLKSFNHFKRSYMPVSKSAFSEKENLHKPHNMTSGRRGSNKDDKEEKKFNLNKVISQTRIIEAPVRHERLPRKQKIEPISRQDEELVFQTVSVSSKGVMETKEDGVVKYRKMLVPTECIQLTDSEDEKSSRAHRKRNTKKKQVEIVISDSEDEAVRATTSDCKTDKKISEGPKTIEVAITKKDQYKCTTCSKTFPCDGSLKTHMQYHILRVKKEQNEMSKEKPTTKYKCETCNETHINAFLLNKHVQMHSAKVKHECAVCKKLFLNQMLLNAHKRTHVKDKRHSPKKGSPPERAHQKMQNTRIARHSVFATSMPERTLPPSRKTISNVPAAVAKPSNHFRSPTSKQHKCNSCNSIFSSKPLLDTHVVKNCVKLPRRVSRGMVSEDSLNDSSKKKLNQSSILNTPLQSKRRRIPLNAGIPMSAKMSAVFHNLQQRLAESSSDGDD